MNSMAVHFMTTGKMDICFSFECHYPYQSYGVSLDVIGIEDIHPRISNAYEIVRYTLSGYGMFGGEHVKLIDEELKLNNLKNSIYKL